MANPEPPILPDISPYKITLEKIPQNFQDLLDLSKKVKLNEKVTNFNQWLKTNGKMNHLIQCTDYDTVFVISDIHADYMKFVDTLVKNNLIGFDGLDENTMDVYRNPYDVAFINNAIWKGGQRTLFLILGDLVDGQRDDEEDSIKILDEHVKKYTVNDEMGSFEFQIHLLIHNLRISALQQKSEILFTIGNHDLATVLDINGVNGNMFNKYVHQNAKNFMIQSHRRAILLPFYQNSPFFFIKLINNRKPDISNVEIVCVHAGIHDLSGTNILSSGWENLQSSMNENGWDIRTTPTLLNNLPTDKQKNGPDLLWDRTYAKEDFSCNKIPENDPIVIVGHCPTSSMSYPNHLYQNGDYSGCEQTSRQRTGRGCISIRCLDNSNNPKIVMVDTASSNAFRTGRDNKTRQVEILKLSKNVDQQGPFYKIDRWLDGKIVDGVPKKTLFQRLGWGSGGRRKRTRRNKKKNRSTRRKW